MGLPNFWISSTLSGVLGQRLVRKLCENCKVKDTPSKDRLKQLNLSTTKTYYKGAGCDQCLNTGYKGRTVISELLIINNDMRRAIESNHPEQKLHEIALESGFQYFYVDASAKISSGVTSIDEVLRVIRV